MIRTSAQMLAALSDHRLLATEQFAILEQTLLPQCQCWEILAKELVFRGWITPFQSRMILRLQTDDLFMGSYVILEPLSEGGSGHVFRAKNWKTGEAAVLKIVREEKRNHPNIIARFLREIEYLGTTNHPHIIRAFDAGYEGNKLYFAMEYIPGYDLGEILLREKIIKIEDAIRFTRQVALAIQHLSHLGLIHRDVKPSNILVSLDRSFIKLFDLGLARLDSSLPQVESTSLTMQGLIIGTPDYLSPEQIRDPRLVDVRSDLYSLGCTLYHMLTGQPPFSNGSKVAIMRDHLYAEPAPVRFFQPQIPIAIQQITMKLLSKRARDRYQDPMELIEELDHNMPASKETVIDGEMNTKFDDPIPRKQERLDKTIEIPIDQLELVSHQNIELL